MTRGQRGQRLWLEGGQRLGRGDEQLGPLRGALVQSRGQLRNEEVEVEKGGAPVELSVDACSGALAPR